MTNKTEHAAQSYAARKTLNIVMPSTVKPWYSGLWNSGIPWNSGQNCFDPFFRLSKYLVIVEYLSFSMFWYSGQNFLTKSQILASYYEKLQRLYVIFSVPSQSIQKFQKLVTEKSL